MLHYCCVAFCCINTLQFAASTVDGPFFYQSWLLWIKQPWTYTLFLFDAYLGMGLLGCKVDVCLTSETTTVFQSRKWNTFNIQYYKSSSYSTCLTFLMSLTPFPSFTPFLSFPNTKMFGIFDFSHSGGYIIVFHCSYSSLMANNVIIGHLLIFSFELSVQVFYPYL